MGVYEKRRGLVIKHDLREVLSIYLMSNGTAGWKEADIFRRFSHIPKEEIMLELEALWAEEKVQRFTLGKKHTVWRAVDTINV